MVDTSQYNSRFWLVKSARKIIDHVSRKQKDYILLETGFGPSGKPHLGTALETIRTVALAEILRMMQDRPVLSIAFCDDIDGLRKIPYGNDEQYYTQYLGHPICKIPCVDKQYASFAERNIASFIKLVKDIGYNIRDMRVSKQNPYDLNRAIELSNNGKNILLLRASDMYNSGGFDEFLSKLLIRHQDVMNIILPTLGTERKKTYSPFMPISPTSGRILQNEVIGYDIQNNTIQVEENNKKYAVEATGKNLKLQWKIDFGMRWAALDIDFEFCGKDIAIGSVPISEKVCQVLDKTPPISQIHEMLLNEDGSKFSKSSMKKSLDLDSMLRYCGPSVMRHIILSNPKSAQKLSMSKVVQYIDLYQSDLKMFNSNPSYENKIFYSDVCFIKCAPKNTTISASEAISLIESMQEVFQTRDMQITNATHIRNYLNEFSGKYSEEDIDLITRMANFYHEQRYSANFIRPPLWMKEYLRYIADNMIYDEENIQSLFYEAGKSAIAEGHIADLKSWFRLLYSVIFGKETGPRLGTFCVSQGVEKSRSMILRTIEN